MPEVRSRSSAGGSTKPFVRLGATAAADGTPQERDRVVEAEEGYALQMYENDGMTLRQIGQMLDVSHETVRKRLKMARLMREIVREVRKRLNESHNAPVNGPNGVRFTGLLGKEGA